MDKKDSVKDQSLIVLRTVCSSGGHLHIPLFTKEYTVKFKPFSSRRLHFYGRVSV